MPELCRFYPGITPMNFRHIAVPDLLDLIGHMRAVQEHEQQAMQRMQRG